MNTQRLTNQSRKKPAARDGLRKPSDTVDVKLRGDAKLVVYDKKGKELVVLSEAEAQEWGSKLTSGLKLMWDLRRLTKKMKKYME